MKQFTGRAEFIPLKKTDLSELVTPSQTQEASMKLPVDEIWFSFSRSSGPGGQNVNKVSSRVTLHWHLPSSKSLSEARKAILQTALSSHIDSEGMLTLNCQESRSQAMNRKLALEKLQQLVSAALIPKKKRRKTKVPRGQIEKRLKQKKSRADRLSNRRIVD